MQTKAIARFIRQSPRKVRLVINLIKGMPVPQAREQLGVLPKRAAAVVLKLLNSAAANAGHNNKTKIEDLFVAQAFVDQGPTIKRYRPRAFGKAGMIRKRTSHITIVLSDKKLKKTKADGKIASRQAKDNKSQIASAKSQTNSKSKIIKPKTNKSKK